MRRTRESPAASGPRRAIGYVRVSTEVQSDEGAGLEVQRDWIETFAKDKGFSLGELAEEIGSGGVRQGEEVSWEHRPVLLSLLTRAQAGEFDLLLVAKLDRLSRDHVSLVLLERRLQKAGVEVLSASEETNGDGPLARYIRGQLAQFAEYERDLIRERFDAGKAQARVKGRQVSGRPPFGFTAEHGKLVPIPPLVQVIAGMFDDAIYPRSPGWIARKLNDAELPTSQGAGAWNRTTVTTILRNPVYRGANRGVEGANEAIVSAKVWRAAQRALANRARQSR